MIKKTKEAAPDGRYVIPLRYPEGEDAKISEKNVRFISWNEADCCLNEETIVRVVNINMLKRAVYHAAKQDEAVCGSMIERFRLQYGIDIHALWDRTDDPAYHIIGDVFTQWAHPMIGNVVVSSGIRPQTSGDQYTRNWDSFPGNYMTVETKTAIKKLIADSLPYDSESGDVSEAGL